jgi:hypothetical protein
MPVRVSSACEGVSAFGCETSRAPRTRLRLNDDRDVERAVPSDGDAPGQRTLHLRGWDEVAVSSALMVSMQRSSAGTRSAPLRAFSSRASCEAGC